MLPEEPAGHTDMDKRVEVDLSLHCGSFVGTVITAIRP